MDAPRYPHKPIYSIKALSLALGESIENIKSLAINSSKLYRYVPQTKRDGSVRDTYDAYDPLKSIQRKIVDRLLAQVKYPKYLHGGIRDVNDRRSIYSNAQVHGKAKTVVLQDIKDFFPSIKKQHVKNIFLGLFDFSDDVSELLSQLTTRDGVVPQGASTSGYLANLIFWDNEPALVANLNEKGFSYSRFADDITISTKNSLNHTDLTEVVRKVTQMLAQKGCQQKRSKLHIRKRGQAVLIKAEYKPLTVTGLSIFNIAPSLPKSERKAIRTAVKHLEDQANQGAIWINLDPIYRRVMGRVGRLVACGHPDGERYKQRLKHLKERYQTPLMDRYVMQDGAELT